MRLKLVRLKMRACRFSGGREGGEGGVRAGERAYERWECPAGAAQLGAKLGGEVCQSLNVPVLLHGNKSGSAC